MDSNDNEDYYIILFSRLKDNDGDTACNYKVDDIIPSLLK